MEYNRDLNIAHALTRGMMESLALNRQMRLEV
jgi:hypothetical protein